MKTKIKNASLAALTLVTLATFLVSFSNIRGGEGFEVYLDSKLVLQQFGKQLDEVRTIALDGNNSSSQLTIRYFHCGKAGSERVITVRDANNKTLRTWKFSDGKVASLTLSDAAMACKVADILSLQNNSGGKLSLYYSSKELPRGRQLAWLAITHAAGHP